MRRILSDALLAVGAVSLTVCIVFAVNVGQSYQRAMGKDDFAGFGLSLHFLLYGLLPLTLSLFIAACLLNPPALVIKRLGISSSATRSLLSTDGPVLCIGGAVMMLVYITVFVGGNLVSAAWRYGHGARGLATIFLQNLILSSPLLVLSALLGWAGRALKRWSVVS